MNNTKSELSEEQRLSRAIELSEQITDLLSQSGMGFGAMARNQDCTTRQLKKIVGVIQWPNPWVSSPNSSEYTVKEGTIYQRPGTGRGEWPSVLTAELIEKLYGQLHPDEVKPQTTRYRAPKPFPKGGWAVRHPIDGNLRWFWDRYQAEQHAAWLAAQLAGQAAPAIYALCYPDQVFP